MSKFKDHIKKETLNEAKVLQFSYSEKIKNFSDLLVYLQDWKSKDYDFDKLNNKKAEVYYVGTKFIGEIKDKGKKFELTDKLSSEKEVIDYIKRGI